MKIQRLRTVLIDDSDLQRSIMEKILKNHPKLELVGSYKNAITAKYQGWEKNLDLLFLDIEMPLISGFDLLESLKEKPQVIVISHSSEYAVKAFDYEVTDYLLKPIETSRFNKAIKRALHNIASPMNFQEDEHLFVKSNFRKVRVNCGDIKWIEALGDYIRLVTESSNIIVQTSMKAFQEKLPKDRFLRIHKSYIINLNRIENFTTTVVEVDGKQMPLSRKRKATFMDALGVE